jgi:hypothetical protein
MAVDGEGSIDGVWLRDSWADGMAPGASLSPSSLQPSFFEWPPQQSSPFAPILCILGFPANATCTFSGEAWRGARRARGVVRCRRRRVARSGKRVRLPMLAPQCPHDHLLLDSGPIMISTANTARTPSPPSSSSSLPSLPPNFLPRMTFPAPHATVRSSRRTAIAKAQERTI